MVVCDLTDCPSALSTINYPACTSRYLSAGQPASSWLPDRSRQCLVSQPFGGAGRLSDRHWTPDWSLITATTPAPVRWADRLLIGVRLRSHSLTHSLTDSLSPPQTDRRTEHNDCCGITTCRRTTMIVSQHSAAERCLIDW